MKKNIIWDNWNIDMDNWADFLEEEYPEVTDESEKYMLVSDMNDEYLNDERMNLDIDLPEQIIVLADIGTWRGRRYAYKVLDEANVAACLHDADCDYCTWYCDRYNMHFDGAHHDGTNHYTYRMFRPGLTEEQKEHFTELIYFGKCNDRAIRRYTVSLQPYVAKVYGW